MKIIEKMFGANDNAEPNANRRSVRAKRSIRTVLATLLALCASQFAVAASGQDLSYTYLEAGGATRSLSGNLRVRTGDDVVSIRSDDQAGLRLAGAIEVGNNLYFVGTYGQFLGVDLQASLFDSGQLAFAAGVLDRRELFGAFGVHWPLGDRVDMFVELGGERVTHELFASATVRLEDGELRVDVADFDQDDTDVAGRLGLRWLASDRVEVEVSARHTGLVLDQVVFVDDDERVAFEEDVIFAASVTALFDFGLGLGARFEAGETETATVFARWRF